MNTFNITSKIIPALPRADLLKIRVSGYSAEIISTSSVGGTGGASWLEQYFTYDSINKALVLTNADGLGEISFANDDGDIIAYSDFGSGAPSFWDGLPIASTTVLGAIKVGTNLTITAEGVLSADAGGASTFLDLTDTPSTYTGSDGKIVTVSGSALVFADAPTAGYWTQTGSDIHYNTGNVGIGTITPAPIITPSAKTLMIESTVAGEIVLSHSDAGTNSVIGSLVFSRLTEALAVVKGNTDGAIDAGKLVFQTQPAGGALTTRISITSTGFVGIGTTNPTELLHIKSGTDASTDIGLEEEGLGWRFRNDQGDNRLAISSVSGTFNTFTERFTILSTGNVGIGTSTPNEFLDISSTASGIRVSDSADSNNEKGSLQVSAGNGGFFRLYDFAGNNHVLVRSYGNSYINGGNVGIGTVSPDSLTHLHKNGADLLISNVSTGLADSGSIRFKEEVGSVDRFFIKHNGSANTLTIGTESVADALVIARATGNVGIGASSPTQKLHVIGNIIATGEVTAYSSSDKYLKINVKPLRNGLEIINSLNPKTFQWNDKAIELASYKDKDTREAGLIAQEVEEVIPSIVGSIYDKYKGIKYEMLTPYIISALQEISERVKYLEHALRDYEK